MKAGYLAIETPPEESHLSGLIRLVSWDELPKTDDKTEDRKFPENIHYIARFNDILAASMHFHNGLRHKLEDLDEHIYRAELTHAIAVIEAEDDLRHERVWIDPAIDQDALEVIQKDAEGIRSKKEKFDKAIQMLGYLAIILLTIYGVATVL